jgi:hypothetical protein
MSYEALMLLPQGTQTSLPEAETRLRQFFSGEAFAQDDLHIDREENRLVLKHDDWSLRVYLDSEL